MRRVGGSSDGRTINGRCFLLSAFAFCFLPSPLPVGLRRQTSIFFLYDYYEVELRERLNLNPITPWPTMLILRVRRQIDAETKSSFPAMLADTESTSSIDKVNSHHKVVYAY